MSTQRMSEVTKMATQRVTAVTTTDEELDAIRELAPDPYIAGRVVVCDLDEAGIAQLEKRGVIVQSIEPTEPEEGDIAPAPGPAIAGLTASFAAPRAETLEILNADVGPRPIDVYLLSLDGPLLPDWRSALEEAGAELLERVKGGDYTVRVRVERIPGVRELDFVRGVRLFTATDTVHPVALAAHTSPDAAGAEHVSYDAYLHPGGDPATVGKWLTEHAVDIAGTGRRKVRFFALRGAPVVAEVSLLPEVAAVEEFVPPRLANDYARVLLGIDGAAGGGAAAAGTRTGKGQTVAVADTGIDEQHQDFQGRIAKVFARGRPNDASDPVGHGTHVAGSVLGDGSASGGAIKGAAPEAELVFQSVLDAQEGLSGLGVDLGDLFDEAYAEGARIHSNSWGALARGAYRMNSLEVDAYVHEHPDMLIVIAAGNSGTAARPRISQTGFVDLLSVDSPGTAKNALTVGASRSDRPAAADETFGVWWPSDFPDPPIASEELSGDAQQLAAFSGRGPCDEQIRITPDVVAPGTFILSTRSSIAPTKEFWKENPANRAYAFMGGTSMATPLVAGCAALVRQYYVEDRNHEPSAALLKATLINGAQWLSGADAVADHPTEPNYHQGFGAIHMPATIPDGAAAFKLAFRDTQSAPAESLAQTGSDSQYIVNVRDGELRLCLAWTDPPGRGLQNTVTVVLENTGTRERWLGNPRRPPGMVGWDAGNNVQVIRLSDAKAGSYRVSVIASNLLVNPQSFALVVTGQLDSDLAQI
jgi:subtilisin family serine protease